MRIVAGTFKGRTISAPAGAATRPTSDRVREALMSALVSMRGGFDEAVVLDAFAGSGALGLEALSRGAARAWFFERDRAAARSLEANIAACGVSRDRVRLVRADVQKAPPVNARPPFDLVFFDPPYAQGVAGSVRLACTLARAGALCPGAIAAFEHEQAKAAELVRELGSAGLEPAVQKKYGKTGVTLVRMDLPDGAPHRESLELDDACKTGEERQKP